MASDCPHGVWLFRTFLHACPHKSGVAACESTQIWAWKEWGHRGDKSDRAHALEILVVWKSQRESFFTCMIVFGFWYMRHGLLIHSWSLTTSGITWGATCCSSSNTTGCHWCGWPSTFWELVSLAPFLMWALSHWHLTGAPTLMWHTTTPFSVTFESLLSHFWVPFVNKIWIDPTWLVGGNRQSVYHAKQ